MSSACSGRARRRTIPARKRLFEGGRFYTDDGRGRFNPVRYRPPAEEVDDEYPVWLTTGRVVSQYLSGTQTRRIGPLVAQYPEPLCELHPRLAERHGIATGDVVRVTSRRGTMTLPANGRGHDPARHGLHPLPLGGHAGRQPADQPGARPAVEDPRVQGVGGAHRAGRAAGRGGPVVDARDMEPAHGGPEP